MPLYYWKDPHRDLSGITHIVATTEEGCRECVLNHIQIMRRGDSRYTVEPEEIQIIRWHSDCIVFPADAYDNPAIPE